MVKSEFETTAQYEKRAAKELKKPIAGDLTVRDTFSIVVTGVRADYDADSQRMQFLLPVEKSLLAEAFRRNGPSDKNTAHDLSRLNLYSIKWPAGYDNDRDEQGLFFDETNGFVLKKKGSLEGFSTEVSLGVEEAKRLKSTVKAVVVVRFEEPYAAGYASTDRQFQVQLIDIIFFDPQTGKILARLSQSAK